MPMTDVRPTTIDYTPFIISDGTNTINLNDQGILSCIENADDQYTYIQDPKYLELIKQNDMEIAGVKFKLTDPVWDFSSKAPDTKSFKYLYLFHLDKLNDVSDYYKTLVELWLLDSLIHYGIHRPVIYSDFVAIRRFVHYLYGEKLYSLDTLSTHNVHKYIDNFDVTTQTKECHRISIRKFMMFYYKVSGQKIDETLIEYLDTNDIQKINAERQKGKLDLLPQAFMKNLVKLLESTLNNEELPQKTRIMAGIILIGTQTGIRPQEYSIIPFDCIVHKSVDGIPYTEFRYLTTKAVKGSGTIEERTFANETTCKAVETIKSFKTSKYLGDIRYIDLYKFFRKFVTKNAEQLGCISDQPLEEFNGTPIEIKTAGGVKYINVPKMKQFRVYLSSELRRRGYNDFAIASLLGHKNEQMLGYYSRPIANFQEDKYFRDIFLRDVIEDDLKIIGPRGDEYNARIKAYMSKNKTIDVRASLREIGDDIDGLMPMKVIPGGFCICPAPKMSCEAMNKDNADSIYCAYGLCSNQSHLYYDMPFHLSQFHNCITSVEYNVKNCYMREAEKELYKAQFICKTLLQPELNELKDLMNRKGSEYVIEKHPEMKPIIDDIENIESEVTAWATMKIGEVQKSMKKRK